MATYFVDLTSGDPLPENIRGGDTVWNVAQNKHDLHVEKLAQTLREDMARQLADLTKPYWTHADQKAKTDELRKIEGKRGHGTRKRKRKKPY